MSAAVQANVWRSAKCASATLLALIVLADEANDAGDVDVALVDVVKKIRATERHVRRVVATLGAMEGIEAVVAGGRIVATLTAFADAPSDAPASPDILSHSDMMSGHLVTDGHHVTATALAAPPTRVVSSPPSGRTQDQDHPSEANASSGVVATPPQDAGEARKRSAAAKPRPATDYGDAFVAVCRACRFDPKALPPQVARNVANAAKTILGIKGSAAEIDAASARWYAEDWRGAKGQAPSTTQLITWVSQCRVAEPPNRSRPGAQSRTPAEPPRLITPEEHKAALDQLAAIRARRAARFPAVTP